MNKTLKIRALMAQKWYNFTEGIAITLSCWHKNKNITYLKKISYGKTKFNKANMMYRNDLIANQKPVLIYIHGGGWISGKLLLRNHYIQEFAKEGFFAYSIDYTVAPQAIYPTALQECFDAIDWLFDNKDKFSIDINQIVIAGESAGSYFITMIADLINNEEKMNRIGLKCKHIKELKIKALISHCGAFDLHRITNKSNKQSKFPDIIVMTKAFIGKTGKEFTNWLKSPESYDASPKVSSSFPPTYIIWAKNDYLRFDSFDFIKDLKNNNIPFEEYKADKEISAHAWSTMTIFPTAKKCLFKTLEFVRQYINV